MNLVVSAVSPAKCLRQKPQHSTQHSAQHPTQQVDELDAQAAVLAAPKVESAGSAEVAEERGCEESTRQSVMS